MSEEKRPAVTELIEVLRRWADEHGWSKSELARKLDIPQATLSRYLSGQRRNLRPETIDRLVERLPGRLRNELEGHVPGPRPRAEKPGVFVSSTYLDNAERRRRVKDAIERAGCRAIAMESWTAHELDARLVSLSEVDNAEVFLGIVAWRYGWIPDGEEKSITELEYETAAELDRLMFVIDERLSSVNIERDFDPGADRWDKQKKLESFKRRIAEEQTARPFSDEDLAVLVMQALNEWKQRRGWDAAEPPESNELPEYESELADYFASVQAEHGTLSIAGFETRLRIPLRLEDLYVPVDVSIEAERIGSDKARSAHEGDEPQTSLAQALSRLPGLDARRGLVLLGHPGSGKTTQLRRVALSVVKDGPGSLGLPEDVVPVFVPLRELEPEDASLADIVRRLVADENVGLGGAFADWLWEQEHLLLLIDGLDEVPERRRADVRGWIEKVARSPRGHFVLVSCRFEGYRGGAQLGAEFLRLDLRPLDLEQIHDLVHNWYRTVETTLVREGGGTTAALRRAEIKARQEADRLLERLRSKRATRIYEFASNPLLLTAICLVHRDRSTLPERRAELYDECINGLLQLWRERHRVPIRLEAAQARQVLQPLALWLHEQEGRTQATAKELEPVLESALRQAKWTEGSAAAFLAKIRDESGLLTGWSSDTYGFLHLGFQEYLAAQELRSRVFARAGDPDDFRTELSAIVDRFGSSWWHEVFCMLLATDEPSLFAPLFDEFCPRPAFAEHAELVKEVVQDAVRFDPAPFMRLLGRDVREGLWRQRRVGVDLLRQHAADSLETVDSAPFLELLGRAPGKKRDFWEQQLGALSVLDGLMVEIPEDLREHLRGHPWAEISRGFERVVPISGKAVGRATLTGNLLVTSRSTRGEYELVKISGGTFLMGSPEGEADRYADEGPQHEVAVPDFYLGRYPVTNEEYGRFLADDPSLDPPEYWGDRRFNQPKQPVVGVSWDEARGYCEWAGLVLPTEAQWEYACRAGTTTLYWSGDEESDLADVGWCSANSDSRLHAVGEKRANPFGLHDMHGNVWEWCEDDWSDRYRESQEAHPDAYKKKGARNRVIRGGGFRSSARLARSAYRSNAQPEYRSTSLGFRPARVITD